MKYIYNNSEKYHDVKVSDVAFSNKDGKVGVEAKLSLVVKEKETGFIETVFTNKVNSGQLHNLKVVNGSAEFNPVGQCIMTKRLKCPPCQSFFLLNNVH